MSRKSLDAVANIAVKEGEREYGEAEFKRRCWLIGAAFDEEKELLAFCDAMVKTGSASKIAFLIGVGEALSHLLKNARPSEWLVLLLEAERGVDRLLDNHCPTLDEFMTRVRPSRNA